MLSHGLNKAYNILPKTLKVRNLQEQRDYENLFKIEYSIIVQHFCIETWALGNREIFPENPKKKQLSILTLP